MRAALRCCGFPAHFFDKLDQPHPLPSPRRVHTQTKGSTLRFARAPEPHVGLKEFGLTALSALLRALNGPRRLSDAATLRLLSRLGALLAAIAPGSLFPDWSPPAMVPEVPVALKASDIVADSERSTTHSGGCAERWTGRECLCPPHPLLFAFFCGNFSSFVVPWPTVAAHCSVGLGWLWKVTWFLVLS